MNTQNTQNDPVPDSGAPLSVSPASFQGEEAPFPPKSRTLPAGKLERIYAPILLVLSLFAADACFYGGQLGVTLSFFLGGGAVLGYLALSRRLRVKAYGLLCLIGAGALAGSFSYTSDWVLLFPSFFLVLFAFLLCLLSWTGVNKRPFGEFSSVWDVASLAFARTFGQMGPAIRGFFRRSDGAPPKKSPSGVFLGILVALPVLLILVPLLIRADAAFEGLTSGISLPSLDWFTIFTGLFVFLLAYPLSVSLRHSAPQGAPQTGKHGSVSPAAITAFLTVISILYSVYLFSQIAYLVNGFLGILPEGYSKAEYARRGFFEMVPIVVINLLILACVLRLVRREAGSAPKSVRCLCLFLIVFSLFLLSTAISKMIFYIGSYGLTYNRLTASFFMVWLAICLLAVGARLFLPKTPYMKIAVIAVLILANLACWGDVNGMIARYNVRAYQSGALAELDVCHLSTLGDSALPACMELLEDPDPDVAARAEDLLAAELLQKYELTFDRDGTPVYTELVPTNWRTWTITGARAKALLEEYIVSSGGTLASK